MVPGQLAKRNDLVLMKINGWKPPHKSQGAGGLSSKYPPRKLSWLGGGGTGHHTQPLWACSPRPAPSGSSQHVAPHPVTQMREPGVLSRKGPGAPPGRLVPLPRYLPRLELLQARLPKIPEGPWADGRGEAGVGEPWGWGARGREGNRSLCAPPAAGQRTASPGGPVSSALLTRWDCLSPSTWVLP